MACVSRQTVAPLFCTVLHLDQCTGADIGVKIANVKTHTFNSPLSGTTRVSRYQKGKTNLDFTEARDSEWQWHQLGHMQVCTQSTEGTTCILRSGVKLTKGCIAPGCPQNCPLSLGDLGPPPNTRHSRQITTPAPYHSVFYRPDALPATQPTASKHWRPLYVQWIALRHSQFTNVKTW